MITTLQLIAQFHTFTQRETPAGDVLRAMITAGTQELDDAQQCVFHDLADEFATRALNYLTSNRGDHDHSNASPGVLIIQNAQSATEKLNALGLPRGHITSHSLFAVARAAAAATTWSYIVLGFVETSVRLATLSRAASPGLGRFVRARRIVFVLANGHEVTTSEGEPAVWQCLTCDTEGYVTGHVIDQDHAEKWHASL